MKTDTKLSNWFGDIKLHDSRILKPNTVAEVITIVSSDDYPSPVRPIGSRHSITPCISSKKTHIDINSGSWGTAVDMTALPEVFDIDVDNLLLTVSAGMKYLNVAKRLSKLGYQFYLNTEIGSLTMGAAACAATKDPTFSDNDFGQLNAYVVGMKLIDATGAIINIKDPTFHCAGAVKNEDYSSAHDCDLFPQYRSSYGLFGLLIEVTFKIKKEKPITIRHYRYSLPDFLQELDKIPNDNLSLFVYLFPHNNSVVVEERRSDSGAFCYLSSLKLKVRNTLWKRTVPAFARLIARINCLWLRNCFLGILNLSCRIALIVFFRTIKRAKPSSQIINFDTHFIPFTFSMWAFPQDTYKNVLKDYFKLCEKHHQQYGYRTSLPDAAYRISKDTNSLLSFSYDSPVWTLDPVSTGIRAEEWQSFLRQFNEFSCQHGGTPLFNQTPNLEKQQAQQSYGQRLTQFEKTRARLDPKGRFLNEYFYSMLQ